MKFTVSSLRYFMVCDEWKVSVICVSLSNSLFLAHYYFSFFYFPFPDIFDSIIRNSLHWLKVYAFMNMDDIWNIVLSKNVIFIRNDFNGIQITSFQLLSSISVFLWHSVVFTIFIIKIFIFRNGNDCSKQKQILRWYKQILFEIIFY